MFEVGVVLAYVPGNLGRGLMITVGNDWRGLFMFLFCVNVLLTSVVE